MANNIKRLVDERDTNPHRISMESGLTYTVVWTLYNAEEIKPTTPIGTLQKIASALGVKVTDLYTHIENQAA